MDSIIRGTNAKIKEDIDFSQLSSVEMCIYQATKKIAVSLFACSMAAEEWAFS